MKDIHSHTIQNLKSMNFHDYFLTKIFLPYFFNSRHYYRFHRLTMKYPKKRISSNTWEKFIIEK